VEQLDDFVHDGKFINRQKWGLRVRDFERESRINKRYQVVATFKTSALSSSIPHVVDEMEYIAILEAVDFPLYFITYEIDYTQYVFSNPLETAEPVVDHSIASRQHA
jgi:hypothetical protein